MLFHPQTSSHLLSQLFVPSCQFISSSMSLEHNYIKPYYLYFQEGGTDNSECCTAQRKCRLAITFNVFFTENPHCRNRKETNECFNDLLVNPASHNVRRSCVRQNRNLTDEINNYREYNLKDCDGKGSLPAPCYYHLAAFCPSEKLPNYGREINGKIGVCQDLAVQKKCFEGLMEKFTYCEHVWRIELGRVKAVQKFVKCISSVFYPNGYLYFVTAVIAMKIF